MRGSETPVALGLAAALACAAAAADTPAPPDTPDPPQRVVSINLCTDQLAMLVAAPGQLVSVSYLAFDPRESAMAEAARAYAPNRALAEEIFLLQPGLVLAGSFGSRATLDMLTRLGVPVARFEPARSLDDVADQIARIGEVLGQPDRATALAADYDARRAALRAEVAHRPRAALYYASGYTSGDRSLASEILTLAGFWNIAPDVGLAEGGVMPLEVLAMALPEAVITPRPYAGGSRAEEILDHPVVAALKDNVPSGSFTDRDWICGTPFVLDAVAGMAALRRATAGE